MGGTSSCLTHELEDVESVESVIGDNFTRSGFKDVATVGSVIVDEEEQELEIGSLAGFSLRIVEEVEGEDSSVCFKLSE